MRCLELKGTRNVIIKELATSMEYLDAVRFFNEITRSDFILRGNEKFEHENCDKSVALAQVQRRNSLEILSKTYETKVSYSYRISKKPSSHEHYLRRPQVRTVGNYYIKLLPLTVALLLACLGIVLKQSAPLMGCVANFFADLVKNEALIHLDEGTEKCFVWLSLHNSYLPSYQEIVMKCNTYEFCKCNNCIDALTLEKYNSTINSLVNKKILELSPDKRYVCVDV
jgi:hypothetical protein